MFADGRKLQFPFTDGSSVSVTLPSYELPRCKNASGYYAADDMDAIDLIIGSDGTLGAITLVELELLPLPEHIWGASCFFASEEQAIAFTQRIRGCFANLAAVEYFDPDALDLLRAQKRNSSAFSSLPDIPADAACCIYAEIREEDRKRAFDSLMALGGCISACGGDEAHTWVARTGLDMERLQFFRHAVPESVNMTIDERRKRDPGITKLAGDMSVPDEYLADVMKMYRESLREYGLQSAVFGHIGNNHLHVNILPADGDDYRRGKELLKKWAARVTEMGGAVSAEHGIGKLKTDFLRIMYGEEHIREMAAVKRAFDPKMILGRDNLFPAALFERAETEGL